MEPASQSCSAPWDSGGAAQSARVLAVGPDAGPFLGLMEEVRSHGGHVEYVSSAAQALRCLTCTRWDIVAPLLQPEASDELQWWLDALKDNPSQPKLVPMYADGGPEPRLDRQEPDSFGAEVAIPLRQVKPLRIGRQLMVAESAAMLRLYQSVGQVAASAATVLLVGESGTGKELVAHALHEMSPRAGRPFVAVNCAAIPETLLESELFGYERGAFTGAARRKLGRWERANGGTLFLDEIADLSLPLQAKILRAIQAREIERLGGEGPVAVDVRLIAASNRDLRERMAAGAFREDLYFRLAVVTLRMPRLIDRGDDVFVLASHFLQQYARAVNKPLTAIGDRALRLLRRHPWPGNVRELQNVLEHASLLLQGDVLLTEHLPEEWRSGAEVVLRQRRRGGDRRRNADAGDRRATDVEIGEQPSASLENLEKQHIASMLRSTGGKIEVAARLLGIHRNTLTRKIRRFGLEP